MCYPSTCFSERVGDLRPGNVFSMLILQTAGRSVSSAVMTTPRTRYSVEDSFLRTMSLDCSSSWLTAVSHHPQAVLLSSKTPGQDFALFEAADASRADPRSSVKVSLLVARHVATGNGTIGHCLCLRGRRTDVNTFQEVSRYVSWLWLHAFGFCGTRMRKHRSAGAQVWLCHALEEIFAC